jgi:hypothetical protein
LPSAVDQVNRNLDRATSYGKKLRLHRLTVQPETTADFREGLETFSHVANGFAAPAPYTFEEWCEQEKEIAIGMAQGLFYDGPKGIYDFVQLMRNDPDAIIAAWGHAVTHPGETLASLGSGVVWFFTEATPREQGAAVGELFFQALAAKGASSSLKAVGRVKLRANAPKGTVPARNVGAQSPQAAQALRRKLAALEQAQQGAARTRQLPDGRIRYYGPERPARTPGPTRGRSRVTEYDPRTGRVRQWEECYDQSGNVNRVHPKMIDGELIDRGHYPPTGTELGQ